MRKKLTQNICRELLAYDPASGVLTWKRRARHWFKSDRSFNSWNSKHAGRPALVSRDTHGHLHGHVLGQLRSAHRVIFLWMTGRWPFGVIDHIDHDRTNNKWENLRDVPAEENARNKALRSDNSSGQTGIRQSGNSWVAQIGNEYLGSFDSFDEACAERMAEQIERGFAPGHGAAPHGDARA
jgi:HNH endonuclease